MGLGFLDHMRIVPDHRIPGMVTYPLDDAVPLGESNVFLLAQLDRSTDPEEKATRSRSKRRD